MKTKDEIIAGLSQDQIQALVQHFNNIFECPALSDHEHNIIYLVRINIDGILYRTSEGILEFDPKIAGVSYSDYEITFEDDNSGSVNLDLTWDFYDLDKVPTIMNW